MPQLRLRRTLLHEPLKSRSLQASVAIMWVDARPHMSEHMSVSAESGLCVHVDVHAEFIDVFALCRMLQRQSLALTTGVKIIQKDEGARSRDYIRAYVTADDCS